MYSYEVMILVDPTAYSDDEDGTTQMVRGLLEKHGAKIHSLEKWDERRLAYEIGGHKRGVYLLGHLEMPGEKVDEMRRESRLVETILRVLFIRLEDSVERHLEATARYYDKMREDQESRRGERERGDKERDRDRDKDRDRDREKDSRDRDKESAKGEKDGAGSKAEAKSRSGS